MKKRLLIIFLCITNGLLGAQEFSLEGLLSAPFPSNLITSPDGSRIAWVLNEKGIRNIFMAVSPEYAVEELTAYAEDTGQSIGQLAFSTDNEKLIFVFGDGPNRQGEIPNPTSNAEGATQEVRLINMSNGKIETLTEGTNPSFSPDGNQVIYTKSGKAYQYDLESRKSEILFQVRGRVGELKYSPKGEHIAFTSNRGSHAFVGVYDLEDRGIKYIQPSVDRDFAIVWSPTGNQLAFLRVARERDRLPFIERRSGLGWSVMVHDIRSGLTKEMWRTPKGPGSVFRGISGVNQLFWGSGNFLIFPYEGDGWTHLYSLKVGDHEPILLTPGQSEVQFVSLNFDGSAVLYSSNQGDIDRQHIWQVAVNGGTHVQLSSGEGIEWSPVETADGKTFGLASSGTVPAHVAELTMGRVRNLIADRLPVAYRLNRLVKPEQIKFQSPDGMIIHGQLFKPKDQPAGSLPAVLFFHGGSRRQMLLGFHHRGYYHNAYAFNQFLASQGYLVLSVNYRSGIGYGLEFREALDYGANGASEYQDVLGAAEYLKSRNDVDPDRIGLWGGSYGGYLTALGLARNSDVFAAGVDVHGVHDWNVVIRNFVPGYQAEKMQEVAMRAFESSPMADLDTWKSPVLLIHGDDDRNVPFSETVDLVEQLRKRDVYFEQLIYPDEVHGFLLHANWINAYQKAKDFLDRMLKNK